MRNMSPMFFFMGYMSPMLIVQQMDLRNFRLHRPMDLNFLLLLFVKEQTNGYNYAF